jgi:dTDP-4-dehydrorhamnose 3,5-epimerase
MHTELEAAVQHALTFQRYGESPAIDGVQYTPLAKHRSLEGSFMEYLRVTDGQAEGVSIPFDVRQISVSQAVPGRINAFHVHPLETQDELWCVIAGELEVWLVDVREQSPTRDTRRRFLLSAEEPGLLTIPTGVAHGYRAGGSGATILYAMNAQFQPDAPNEGRLPWDFFGSELWEGHRG